MKYLDFCCLCLVYIMEISYTKENVDKHIQNNKWQVKGSHQDNITIFDGDFNFLHSSRFLVT